MTMCCERIYFERCFINNILKHFNRNKRKEKKNKKQAKVCETTFKKGQTGTIDNVTKNNAFNAQKVVTPSATSTTAKYTYKPCHSGNVALTKLDGATLYAGGWTRGAKSANCAVIDLTGDEYKWNTGRSIKAENQAGELAFQRTLNSIIIDAQKDNAKAWISMPIKDYGTPAWTRATWINLAVDVFDILKSGQDVLVACTGGHGRTGLAISILLYLLAVVPQGTNPVEYVRKVYCDEAIETYAQENYVYATLELPFTASYANYKTYSDYNRSYWYDDDYYGTKLSNGKISKFGHCDICKEYKWLTEGVCDKCNEWIDSKEQELEKDARVYDDVGACPYCGDSNVALTNYKGDMICSLCVEWSKKREEELAKKAEQGVYFCSYCGDNVETPTMYYNNDLICERCYIELYATGLTSDLIEDEKGKRIVLRPNETGKDTPQPKETE